MFIRTIKEFNRHYKETDQCAYCGHRLIAPPVIQVDERGYHANCGMQLAWRLLFSITGEPDLRPIERVDLEDNPLLSPLGPLQKAPYPFILRRTTKDGGAHGEPANVPGNQT